MARPGNPSDWWPSTFQHLRGDGWTQFTVAEKKELIDNAGNAHAAYELMPGTRDYEGVPAITHFEMYIAQDAGRLQKRHLLSAGRAGSGLGRICVWGSSFAGGYALVTASLHSPLKSTPFPYTTLFRSNSPEGPLKLDGATWKPKRLVAEYVPALERGRVDAIHRRRKKRADRQRRQRARSLRADAGHQGLRGGPGNHAFRDVHRSRCWTTTETPSPICRASREWTGPHLCLGIEFRRRVRAGYRVAAFTTEIHTLSLHDALPI